MNWRMKWLCEECASVSMDKPEHSDELKLQIESCRHLESIARSLEKIAEQGEPTTSFDDMKREQEAMDLVDANALKSFKNDLVNGDDDGRVAEKRASIVDLINGVFGENLPDLMEVFEREEIVRLMRESGYEPGGED